MGTTMVAPPAIISAIQLRTSESTHGIAPKILAIILPNVLATPNTVSSNAAFI